MNWRVKFAGIPQDWLWALLLGVASSIACAGVKLFFRLLQWLFTGNSGLLSQSAEGVPLWLRAVLPAAGAVAAMLVIWMSRRYGSAGEFEGYVKAARLNSGHVAFTPTLWRTIASGFSVATGAAIGKEGSMIQFAAAATSWLGRRTGLGRMPLATQVACGTAAAVATAYQAPLAGVFFAAEILMGRVIARTIPLLLISAFAGSLTGGYLLGWGPLFAVRTQAGFHLDASDVLPIALLGASMGVLGPVYYSLVRSLRFAAKWPLPLLWSAMLVGLLSVKSTLVWGNGDAALLGMMQASPAVWTVISVLIFRLCATIFCVGTGTAGGVFTPTLFAGSALGFLTVHLLHGANPVCFAILSMGSLLAAATHAPLMSTFMAVELTGQWTLLPVVLGCNLLAWIVAKNLSPHSLYEIATPAPASSSDEMKVRPLPIRTGARPRRTFETAEAEHSGD